MGVWMVGEIKMVKFLNFIFSFEKNMKNFMKYFKLY